MIIQPIGDAIVVEQDGEHVTKTGVVVAGAGKPSRGKVLFIGPGKLLENGKRFPMQVKVGDEVFFHKYAVVEVQYGEKPVLFMRENSDVLGIIKKK